MTWYHNQIGENEFESPQPRGVHCTKHVQVYVSAQRGINLNTVVLRIHTINTFRPENIHVYLH
jgi:hypothetical protein